jgi:carbon storage regulator
VGVLILNRKPGGAILIDGGIRIVVLAADSRGVQLGITAPAHIGILREEIVDRISEENRRATAGDVIHWTNTLPPKLQPKHGRDES